MSDIVIVHHARERKAETFADPDQRCPLCGAFAICKLPPILRSKQPDATTHVCHPVHGGCNHGFEALS